MQQAELKAEIDEALYLQIAQQTKAQAKSKSGLRSEMLDSVTNQLKLYGAEAWSHFKSLAQNFNEKIYTKF